MDMSERRENLEAMAIDDAIRAVRSSFPTIAECREVYAVWKEAIGFERVSNPAAHRALRDRDGILGDLARGSSPDRFGHQLRRFSRIVLAKGVNGSVRWWQLIPET